MTHWLNRALTMTFVGALALFASAGMAATSTADGGGDPGAGALVLTVDDSGGLEGWTATYNGNTIMGTNGAKFTLADVTDNEVVGGQYTAALDWTTATAIAAGPDIDDNTATTIYSTTTATYTATTTAGGTVQVDQYTFANDQSTDAFVIVVFEVSNASTGTINDVLPTLWTDFDPAGSNQETWQFDATRTMVYHTDDSGGSNEEVGLVLLTPAIANGAFTDVTTNGNFPTTDAAEIAIVNAGVTAPADSAVQDDYTTALTGASQSIGTQDDNFVIAFAIVAGTTNTELNDAADAAIDAWDTDAGITGFTGTLSEIVDGTTAASGLTVNEGGFPGPVVSSITPANGEETGGDTVTIGGILLTDVTSVSFGGSAGSNLTVVDDFSLTVDSAITSVGGVTDLILSTATDSTELAAAFDYDSCTVNAPTIVSISPDTGDEFSATLVTITGTNFWCNRTTMEVTFDGVDATGVTVSNDTTLLCSTPTSVGAGAVDVTITNGVDVATELGGFTFEAASSGGGGTTANEAALFAGKDACSLDAANQWPALFAILAASLIALRLLVLRRQR